MAITVLTPPALEPVTLDEAKAHLRVDTSDDDAYILDLITAARTKLEDTYRISCMTQTLVLGLDYFGQGDYQWNNWSWPAVGWWGTNTMIPQWAPIELRWPLQSITSIVYTDTSGTPQTLSNTLYVTDTNSNPPRVAPAIGKLWPIAAFTPGAVTITFVAGFATRLAVPGYIKQAIKLILGTWYEGREQGLIGPRLVAVELPYGVEEIMGSKRFWLVR